MTASAGDGHKHVMSGDHVLLVREVLKRSFSIVAPNEDKHVMNRQSKSDSGCIEEC